MTQPEYLTHRDRTLGVDRRQRLAAAQLLLAFDLPAPMDLVGRQMLDAADLMKGKNPVNMAEIEISTRRSALVRAARLIEQMILEIEAQDFAKAVSGVEPVEPPAAPDAREAS